MERHEPADTEIQNQQDCLFITVTNYGESSMIQIPFLQSMTLE